MEDGKIEVAGSTEVDTTASRDFFCELCSLEFTTKSELKEHTWSLLHNTNLNKKNGRECAHQCSLCNQEFVGLLNFTSHLHSEAHQENIHKWRKKQEADQSCEENGQEETVVESERTSEDVLRIKNTQAFYKENCKVPIMADYYGNRDYHWGPRGPPVVHNVHTYETRSTDYGIRNQDQLNRHVNGNHGQPSLSERQTRDEYRGDPYEHHQQEWTGGDQRQWRSRGSRQGSGYKDPYQKYRKTSYEKSYYDSDSCWQENIDGELYDTHLSGRDRCFEFSRNRNQGLTSDRGSGDWYGHGRRNKNSSSQKGRRNEPGIGNSSNGPFHRNDWGRPESRVSDRCASRNSNQGRKRVNGYGAHGRVTTDYNSSEARKDGPEDMPQSREGPSCRNSRKSMPRKLARWARAVEEKEDGTINTSSIEQGIHSSETKKEDNAENKKSVSHSFVKGMSPAGSAKTSLSVTTSSSREDSIKAASSVTNRENRSVILEEVDRDLDSPLAAKVSGESPLPIDSDSIQSLKMKGESLLTRMGKVDHLYPSKERGVVRDKFEPLCKEHLDKEVTVPLSSMKKINLPSCSEKELFTCTAGNVSPSTERQTDKKETEKGKDLPASKEDKTEPESVPFSIEIRALDKRERALLSNEVSVSMGQGDNGVSSQRKRDSIPSVVERGVSVMQPKGKGNICLSLQGTERSRSSCDMEEPSLSTIDRISGSASSFKEKAQSSSSSLSNLSKTGLHLNEKENQSLNFSMNENNLGVKEEPVDICSRSVDKERSRIDAALALGDPSTTGWKETEEDLRSLLGIKKEPQGPEVRHHKRPLNQDDTTAFSSVELSSTPADTGSKGTKSVSSGLISLPMSLLSPSNKLGTSRHVPVLSQLSLSRPQCSFVHIDGVQCGAVTWNKYCSYHQRIQSPKAQDQSDSSDGCNSTRDIRPSSTVSVLKPADRAGGSRIIKPQNTSDNPSNPAELPGEIQVGNVTKGIGDSLPCDNSVSKGYFKKSRDSNKDGVVPYEEIDLRSTLPSVMSLQDSKPADDLQMKIDLRDTVPKPGRSSGLNATADVSKTSGIDLRKMVPERNLMFPGEHFNSDIVPKISRTYSRQKTAISSKSSVPPSDSVGGVGMDLSETGSRYGKPLSSASSALTDNGPNIDLSQTVPRFGGMVMSSVPSPNDVFGQRSSHGGAIRSPGTSVAPHNPVIDREIYSRSGATDYLGDPSDLRNFRLQRKRSEGISADGQTRHISSLDNRDHSNQSDKEMIDLNFSSKLLAMPHSVVSPSTVGDISSPEKALSPFGGEEGRSPAELYTKSFFPPAVSSPQSPLSSRVSTGSGAPSPGSTVSLPNLSIDLSRFNLPPAVRRVLTERYSNKSESTGVNAPTDLRGTLAEGRRSQPLFTEDVRNRGSDVYSRTVSAVPGKLRPHRSISLDSHVIRSEKFSGEASLRGSLGNFGDTTHQITERNRYMASDDSISEQLRRDLSNAATVGRSKPVFKNFLSSSVNVRSVSKHETSYRLQRHGLIDLNSTSYLDEIAEPSSKHTNQRVDMDKSTETCTMLPNLIDLNSHSAFSDLVSPKEKVEFQSFIKRKRLSPSLEADHALDLNAENVVKRRKHEESVTRLDTGVTYSAGLNVQDLLTIERDEQEQLQALHSVQSRLKSVRAQIQKLCTELDSLHSEENRISARMGELRNLRLSILESACYEKKRGNLPTKAAVVSSETTKAATETAANRINQGSRLPEMKSNAKNGTNEATTTSVNSPSSSSRQDLLTMNEEYGMRSDYEEKDMEIGSDTDQLVVTSVVKHYCGINTKTSSRSSLSPGERSPFVSSLGACPKTVGTLGEGHCANTCQDLETARPRVIPSCRTAGRCKSTGDLEDNRLNFHSSQERMKSKDLLQEIHYKGQDDATKDSPIGSVSGTVSSPIVSEDPYSRKRKEMSGPNSQTSNDLGRKIKHVYRPEKRPSNRKGFSDVNILKTIENSRKRFQSVKANMKRWKQLEEGIDEFVAKHKKHEDSLPTNIGSSGSSCANDRSTTSSGTNEKQKFASRKTSKELKKSSLFNHGRKNPKDSRKDNLKSVQYKDTRPVPGKKRKFGGSEKTTASNDRTSSNMVGKVVSAVAHTTTAELGGSGSEDLTGNEEEIPTRDVDTEETGSEDQESTCSRRTSQLPSSTMDSLRKSLQNGRGGQSSRGGTSNKFSGHTGAVCGLKVHNGRLFSCSADKTTRSFDLQTGECTKTYQGHHQAVNCLEILQNEDRLFTGSNDQTVRSYNIKSGVCTHKFTFDGRVMCLHAAFDLLFVGLNTGIVASIDLKANQCLERLHCHEPRGISCITTATEGQRKLLCTGSFDSTIAIRDYKTGLLIRSITDHAMTVLCLQVVENVVYSGSADMKVQAHNLNTGELLRTYDGHSMSVSGLQIVGRVLVTSCLDKLIRCYDLVSAELLQVYGGQNDMIFSIHVSNGKMYSGARDGSVLAVKLDLRVYHPCKWTGCQLNFGILTHLKNHLREYHVIEQGTVEACHWAKCGHQFSAEDDIKVVLKHVLGHVVSRTARKSVT